MDSLYRLGIDVGSTTVKIVITDDEHNIIYSNYTRHFSDIKMTVNNLLRSAAEKYPDINVTPSITGSGGLLLAGALGIPFVQEVIATKAAVKVFVPDADVVIELGGEDAKILYFSTGIEQRMNGTCAGGTGAFIDQMASSLKRTQLDLTSLQRAIPHYILLPPDAAFSQNPTSSPCLTKGFLKKTLPHRYSNPLLRKP